MLSFMGESKRLLNIHDQKFAELATFQVNTTVFQANTNASLKNMEVQVEQLALNMQNQTRDSFLVTPRRIIKIVWKLLSGVAENYRKEKMRRG